MTNESPTLWMLVGVPASGKSTWVADADAIHLDGIVIVSSDNEIEDYAASVGKTYSEVFKEYASTANAKMMQKLQGAIRHGDDIIWDQTNLNAKTRKGKLSQVPKTYRKVAVVFKTPEFTEHMRRLNSRNGKSIPMHVINSMKESMTIPSLDEGFDEVIIL